ncbi:MAG: septum formation initiator family protein [Candidatus Omnitrophica bacterium]|nr:septum formation initiator family protein [Candidatus Omnitrophota bacterium]MDD5488171.1 septum formation initiator family protein [Candidatus Omnitrophota bacterium]
MEGKKITLYAVIMAVVLYVVFLPGFSELQRMREEEKEQEKRVQLLEEENERLKEKLARLRNDPVYLEKVARDKLGIVRKGEIIYRPSDKK